MKFNYIRVENEKQVGKLAKEVELLEEKYNIERGYELLVSNENFRDEMYW